MRERVRYGAEVVSVTRDGFDKMKSPGRDEAPFLVTVRSADGSEDTIPARAVIDASGTWTRPNPLGAAGRPAIGERAVADRIAYGIPDVVGTAASAMPASVLVIGSGHWPSTPCSIWRTRRCGAARITWAIRKPASGLGNLFGGGIDDALPSVSWARGSRRCRGGSPAARHRFAHRETDATPDGIVVSGQDSVLPPVDEIIGATGFRPDLDLLSELRLGLDRRRDPTALACRSTPTSTVAARCRPTARRS